MSVPDVSASLVGFSIICFRPKSAKTALNSLFYCFTKSTFKSPSRVVSCEFSETLESMLFKWTLKSLQRFLELSGGRYIIPTKKLFESFGQCSIQIASILSFSKSRCRSQIIPSRLPGFLGWLTKSSQVYCTQHQPAHCALRGVFHLTSKYPCREKFEAMQRHLQGFQEAPSHVD